MGKGVLVLGSRNYIYLLMYLFIYNLSYRSYILHIFIQSHFKLALGPRTKGASKILHELLGCCGSWRCAASAACCACCAASAAASVAALRCGAPLPPMSTMKRFP